uniref:Ig-like domain-containing protein n=1 Tax=Terrapene triunguis TaxID=2587831 RepID=A0A674JU07_9SAUR
LRTWVQFSALSQTSGVTLGKSVSLSEDTLHSPIFIQEPYDTTYSIGSEDPEILLNCTAKGYPLPYYR